jgi:hypothetical protein
MNGFMESVATIALAVIGLAIVAVIVSKKSNAAGVIQAGASGLANNIGTAISPVTGANAPLHLDYPGAFGGFGG